MSKFYPEADDVYRQTRKERIKRQKFHRRCEMALSVVAVLAVFALTVYSLGGLHGLS
jgi:hypothetical protein